MSTGAGNVTAADAAERPSSFFDKTENNYRNIETRSRDCIARIDSVCDSINGGVPREASIAKGAVEPDRHPAAFDRCDAAENNMYGAMNLLEEAILRLENLGLT